MKVSVITVCFNSVSTIRDTLISVAGQTHPDIEHIIIDGQSTDGTLEIVTQYSARIAKVLSEPDLGIYDAMNKGIRVATGDVIAFLNADDIYANSDAIARVVRTFEMETLDAVFGDVMFYRHDRPLHPLRRYSSEHFRPARIAWGWMPAHPALFLKREVFDRVGPFRTDYHIAGDFEFVARAFYNSGLRYRYISEVLVNMSMGGVSTGGLRNTALLNREVLRACRENSIPTNILKILSKYPIKVLEFLRS